MCTHLIYRLLLVTVVVTVSYKSVRAVEPLEERVAAALELLEGAESRFTPPDPAWFVHTQQQLREEVAVVEAKLDAQGEEYAAAWKSHLRWPLLRSNLGNVEEVNVAELALVRRWMFSNRKGLEYPFFAELRDRTEAHLDAVVTFAEPDLRGAYEQQLIAARRQLYELISAPNDVNSAVLGRTLGWLEQTRQLPSEVAAIRRLVSLPNAQMVIDKGLIDRGLAVLASEVEQTLSVSDHTTTQTGGLRNRPRAVNVYGKAHTKGRIGLELIENASLAQLQLVYVGEIVSRCKAYIDPIVVGLKSTGPVKAMSPVQVSMAGVQVMETEVDAPVKTRVTGVYADNGLIRRMGERRVYKPESMQQMRSRAKVKAETLMREQMEQRIEEAIAEIRAQFLETKNRFDGFQEVLAPVVREGAAPSWKGFESTTGAVMVYGEARRREQLGTVLPCPATGIEADIVARIHVSFFNNMAETIMAGKTFTDKYFMRFARIVQAELPPRLMVHSRAQRWAMIAAKPRPLEISIPGPGEFRIEMRMQRVEIGEEAYDGPTIVVADYRLVENEFGDRELVRQGDVEVESTLPKDAQEFLLSKMDAFFAPVLNGAGVALPEGGTLGRLRGLEPNGFYADQGWLAFGLNVPTEMLEAWLPEVGE